MHGRVGESDGGERGGWRVDDGEGPRLGKGNGRKPEGDGGNGESRGMQGPEARGESGEERGRQGPRGQYPLLTLASPQPPPGLGADSPRRHLCCSLPTPPGGHLTLVIKARQRQRSVIMGSVVHRDEELCKSG